MNRILVLFLTTALILPVFGQGNDAAAVLAAVDRNLKATTQSFAARMTIERGSRRLVKEFTGYGRTQGGKEEFYMEFTNPEDRGVRYLKLGDDLWIYFPDADDVMKISGHMLRRGMMGSDVSYEDMLEFEQYLVKYDARLDGETTVDGTPCLVLELTAKKPDATYYRQRLAVDRQRHVIRSIELYAESGRLLKRITQDNVRQIGGRFVPMRITVSDGKKGDARTIVDYRELTMDRPVPAAAFTRAHLSR
jgi:outer membrane lipoprotein-sorting protein